MSLSEEAAINWIRDRARFGARPGLDRVLGLLQIIGNPERNIPTIHIAGTNGKGSTVTYLRCMLQELGLKVGTFISPYVLHYNEQIAINGKYITGEVFVHYVQKYKEIVKLMDQEPAIAGITEFEVVTVLALDYFFQEQVDVAIVEVGMGGLLDSTNVVCPQLVAITTIGKDHTNFLGETLEEIALHKAGIIKENVPVITGNIEPAPLSVIKSVAESKKCKIYCYNEDYRIEYLHPDKNWGEVFNFYGPIELKNVKVPLLGKHQSENAAVAIQLFILYCQLRQTVLPVQNLYSGLEKAQWPVRMEKVSDKPLIILDGAHNDHAVYRLAENLTTKFAGRNIHILFSALSTKNIDQMIRTLQGIPNVQLHLTTFEHPNAVELSKLDHFQNENTKVVSIWQEGLEKILEINVKDVTLVTGSLYFVSQVRKFLFYQRC